MFSVYRNVTWVETRWSVTETPQVQRTYTQEIFHLLFKMETECRNKMPVKHVAGG